MKTSGNALLASNGGNSDAPAFPLTIPPHPLMAIGTRGLLAGRRLTLRKRMCVGSWKAQDGKPAGAHYAWWCEYERDFCGRPGRGYELVNEAELVIVMSFEVFAERRAA